MRNIYKILVGKPEGEQLGRPVLRLEDNIRMDLKETQGRAWTGFTWLRIGINGGRM
jgi:hypothetical protein